MCTLIALRRAETHGDLVVALNRDEFHARPTAAPELRGDAIYGLDLERGGTWFGARTSGLFVALTNRRGEAVHGAVRSRGDLVLAALQHAGVSGVRAWLGKLDARAYSGFNLMFGDIRKLYLAIGGYGRRRIRSRPIHAGLSIVLNDTRVGGASEWKRCALRRWIEPELMRPWPELRTRLERVLASHQQAPRAVLVAGEEATSELECALSAVCVHAEGYGTRSSTIVRVREAGLSEYVHCEGAPCRVSTFRSLWSSP